jgi:amidase
MRPKLSALFFTLYKIITLCLFILAMLIQVYFQTMFLAILAIFPAFLASLASGQEWEALVTNFPSLINVTTEDLVVGLEAGLFTSVDLVNTYIARINEVNDTLHAVTQLNPDALMIAQTLDAERQNGTVRGPLHGIPILIKNNIATMDKMDNTAGSYALNGAKVPRDSTIAMKLRQAGAIILGKSNLSQWANYRSYNTSNGWSAIGGSTKGAYYVDQDPSGSSSGSAVSASIGLSLAALGSETDGSIISPASSNNVVGIKPSVGLTSRDLVIPISQHQDTVGPLARTVKDAAYLLSAIAGPSPYDNYTSAIPFTTIPDYVAACNFSALRGKRIGIPRNIFDVPENSSYYPEITAFNAALKVLEAAGATIIDNTNFTGYELEGNSSSIVLAADFTNDLASYLSELTYNPQNIYSVADLTNFTTVIDPVQEDYPARDVNVWYDSLDLGFNNTAPEFWAAYQTNLLLAGPWGITGALANYSLDALVLPTDFASHYPALLGSPVVSVPLGFFPPNTTVEKNGFGDLNAIAPGYPFGIAFLGPRFSEELLIGLAYAFEQRTHYRSLGKEVVFPTTEL